MICNCSLFLDVYLTTAKVAQLLEHSEECCDRMYNKRYYENVMASNLFEHFLDVTNARPLLQKLEKLAESFLLKLYPRADHCCRGKPKITFNLDDLDIEGFHGFSKSFGVSRTVYQEVSGI